MRDLNDSNDPLVRVSNDEPARAPDVRDVSDRLLAEISRIRHLELESRKVHIGSCDFLRMSEEVAVRSRSVFRLSHQQYALARALAPQAATINEPESGSDAAS
jgi:hypothetical protein